MHKAIKFIIHIIAAISWPPPLISQLFHPEGHTLFKYIAWLFLCGLYYHYKLGLLDGSLMADDIAHKQST